MKNVIDNLLQYFLNLGIKTCYNKFYVDIGPCIGTHLNKIWTLSMNTDSPNTPIVLIHG